MAGCDLAHLLYPDQQVQPLKDPIHIRLLLLPLATVTISHRRHRLFSIPSLCSKKSSLVHKLMPPTEERPNHLDIRHPPDLCIATEDRRGEIFSQVSDPLRGTFGVVVDHPARVEEYCCRHLCRVLFESAFVGLDHHCSLFLSVDGGTV